MNGGMQNKDKFSTLSQAKAVAIVEFIFAIIFLLGREIHWGIDQELFPSMQW